APARARGSASRPRTPHRRTGRTAPRACASCSAPARRPTAAAARVPACGDDGRGAPGYKVRMDHSNRPKDQEALVIKADDEVAKGRFSNLAQVASNQDAFVLDFAFVQGKAGWLLARILVSPQH